MAMFGFLGSCSDTSEDGSEDDMDNVSDSGAGKETTDSAIEEETADFAPLSEESVRRHAATIGDSSSSAGAVPFDLQERGHPELIGLGDDEIALAVQTRRYSRFLKFVKVL